MGGADSFGGLRRRLSSTPDVTTTIIVICVLVAIFGRIQPRALYIFYFIPGLWDSSPWTFVTSTFLHAGFWHLAFNMYALWIIGQALEPALGKTRFAVLYLLSGIGGNVAVLLSSYLTSNWMIAAVGASGSIFGLFGALAMLARRVRANMTSILVLLGVNLVFSFMVPGISWESHVGGLLVGAALTWLWIAADNRVRTSLTRGNFRGGRRSRVITLNTLSVVAVSAVLVAIIWYAG